MNVLLSSPVQVCLHGITYCDAENVIVSTTSFVSGGVKKTVLHLPFKCFFQWCSYCTKDIEFTPMDVHILLCFSSSRPPGLCFCITFTFGDTTFLSALTNDYRMSWTCGSCCCTRGVSLSCLPQCWSLMEATRSTRSTRSTLYHVLSLRVLCLLWEQKQSKTVCFCVFFFFGGAPWF